MGGAALKCGPPPVGAGSQFPESGDLRAMRLSNAGPRLPAQLVNFQTPFSPETLDPVFALKRATESSENAPPPFDILTGSRDPGFRVPLKMSPEIADCRVGPKSGDFWAGRLSDTDSGWSAQLVDFRASFSPGPQTKTRDGDVRNRAAGT